MRWALVLLLKLVKMGQSLLNTYCPLSTECCFGLPLKVGCVIISVVSFVPSLLYFLLFDYGDYFFGGIGMPQLLIDILIHIYVTIGILLGYMNVVLLVSSLTYNENLMLLHLWFCVTYFTIDTTLVTVVGFYAVFNDYVLYGILLVAIDTVYWFCVYYFVAPIVNGFRRNIHTVVIVLG